jgi:hypothetical protein
MTSECGVFWKGKPLGRLRLQVPGRTTLQRLGRGRRGPGPRPRVRDVRDALGEFTGVDRRFQIRGEARAITVVDDYAHHPAEIQATLNAAKDGFGRQVIAVFQPHRYSQGEEKRLERIMLHYRVYVVVSYLPVDKSFHFYADYGKDLNVHAASLQDFCEKISSIDINSVEFHTHFIPATDGEMETMVFGIIVVFIFSVNCK